MGSNSTGIRDERFSRTFRKGAIEVRIPRDFQRLLDLTGDGGNVAPTFVPPPRPLLHRCELLIKAALATFGNPAEAGLTIGVLRDLEVTVFWCTIKRNSTPWGPEHEWM